MIKKLWVLGAFFVFFPVAAFAADSINWTFYAPGAAGNMQGSGVTAYPDASGRPGALHTLDDVRNGTSRYVTIASATVVRGKWYCIGPVTYTSPIDRQTHTLQNVVGYVNDTGCAFNGTCSCGWLPQFCNRQPHPEKMDIAVGNFNGWGALQAAQFVTKNPNRAPAVWQQIAGLPNPGFQSNGTACNGIPQESGVPAVAPYSPSTITDPYNTFNPYSAYGNVGMQPGSPSIPGTFQPMNPTPTFGAGFPGFSNQSGSIPIGNSEAIGGTNSPSTGTTGVQSGPPGAPALNLVVYPHSLARGGTLNVIWTSVNMTKDSCQVLFEGSQFAKTNEGTKLFKTVSSDASTLKFTFECNGADDGKPYQISDSATIQ